MLMTLLCTPELTIYSSVHCAVRMNRALSSVISWLSVNHLTLNVDKSQFVVFSRRQRRPGDINCTVTIGGAALERVSCVKFLRVQLDENLLWSEQIDGVVRKVSKFVPMLYRIRDRITPRL